MVAVRFTESNMTNMREFGDGVTHSFGRRVGAIKWYNAAKGYGFLTDVKEPELGDVFFHASSVVQDPVDPDSLSNKLQGQCFGLRVEYTLQRVEGKYRARNLGLIHETQ